MIYKRDGKYDQIFVKRFDAILIGKNGQGFPVVHFNSESN
jgi:hypothetical protein